MVAKKKAVKYSMLTHMKPWRNQNFLSRFSTKIWPNCKQMESLVTAVRGGLRISETFSHYSNTKRGSFHRVDMNYLRKGSQFCDWNVPLMDSSPIIQGLKCYRVIGNEPRLVMYFLAGARVEGAKRKLQSGLDRYPCNEHNICSPVNEVSLYSELNYAKCHIQSSQPRALII